MAFDDPKHEAPIQRQLRLIDERFAEDAKRQRAAKAYAGPNPMAHHEGAAPRTAGDVFADLNCPNRRKFLAGRELVVARLHRKLGYLAGAKAHLSRATALRSQAAEMLS